MAHVGTFNANPVCAAAALAAITWLEAQPATTSTRHSRPTRASSRRILVEESHAAGVQLQVNQDVGTMCAFVADHPLPPTRPRSPPTPPAIGCFAQGLLENGMHVIPRGLLYLSTEHGAEELDLARASVAAAAASYALQAGGV